MFLRKKILRRWQVVRNFLFICYRQNRHSLKRAETV